MAFYASQDAIRSQREAVARYILSETKAGRWVWIGKIAENAARIGHPGLFQRSSASRALNELKGIDIIIDKQTYVLHKGISFRPGGCSRTVEPWAMVLKNK